MTQDQRPKTPAQAWDALVAGNQRFLAGHPLHPNQDTRHRIRSATGQAPFAVILGCSDSRVAAEIIFDRGLGDLFVVRSAGHLLGTDALASVEFAVDALGVPLIVVLGHDSCGAVATAVTALDSGTVPQGFQRAIVEHLLPGVLAARAEGITDRDGIGRTHTAATADLLLERSSLVRTTVADGRCAVVAASYQLRDGQVHLIASHGLLIDRRASTG